MFASSWLWSNRAWKVSLGGVSRLRYLRYTSINTLPYTTQTLRQALPSVITHHTSNKSCSKTCNNFLRIIRRRSNIQITCLSARRRWTAYSLRGSAPPRFKTFRRERPICSSAVLDFRRSSFSCVSSSSFGNRTRRTSGEYQKTVRCKLCRLE